LRPIARLLPDVDVLTVHVPLLAETRGMIGDAELRLLPRHALVVNAARGGIIDEAALATAIAEDRLGGAALDVFEHEPFLADDPLAALENVVLSPHYAAFTREATARMIQATGDNLVAVASGMLPESCVNRDALQSHEGSH
jgi:phosphoglycerate dehydrogenase-like enzyme